MERIDIYEYHEGDNLEIVRWANGFSREPKKYQLI